MPATTATAPGKIILFGEHAVVYGQPAIAAPVTQVRARAVVTANPRARPGAVLIQAPNIGLEAWMEDLPQGHPLAAAVQAVLQALHLERSPACTIRITSTIPVAAGLGSGAAVSVALARAFSAFLGRPLDDETISGLAYEVEKIHHGTPSGIDNTVITYAQPVFFQRGQPMLLLHLAQPLTLVIGDTGVASPTAAVVGDVRQAWQANPQPYNQLFERIGVIALSARQAIESGQAQALGELMRQNHRLLQEMGVSSPELDRLVEAACQAGAWGAKLSGAGRGGNMIAIADEAFASIIAEALTGAGARRVVITTIRPKKSH